LGRHFRSSLVLHFFGRILCDRTWGYINNLH
jgi:hypothetical protein